MDEITIQLRKPVALGDITYSTLDLKEPTAGQLEKAASSSSSSVGMVINLISTVAVVPRKVVEGLCQRDFKEASDFLEAFESQPTGSTS